MATLLSPLLKEGWIKNYLDDLIIWAPELPSLTQRLRKTFTLLNENGVKLDLSKCKITKNKVTFLGYRISEEGSQPDPKNVEAVLDMKPLTKVKEVRIFLGMTMQKIATPLTNLTRKKQTFKWTDQCQTAFETMKEYLSKASVLVRAHPFIITTDACNTHVGGVLSQTQNDGETKPLGYLSKKLNSTDGRYSATDKDPLAVVLACRHFHHYLWGTKFTILTDHQPLTVIFQKKTKPARMNR